MARLVLGGEELLGIASRPPMDSEGVCSTTRVRSNSDFRAMIVVISETVMRLTSSPSIAMMRSPGDTFSAKTLEVRTPETTVPLESALLAKMIPIFPGGATTVTLLRLDIEEGLFR